MNKQGNSLLISSLNYSFKFQFLFLEFEYKIYTSGSWTVSWLQNDGLQSIDWIPRAFGGVQYDDFARKWTQ